MLGDAPAEVRDLPAPPVARVAPARPAPPATHPPSGLELPALALRAAARTIRLLILTIFVVPQFVILRRSRPVVLKRYLQGCGGAFVKLGQMLAMRYDLLPEAYCEELMNLLDRMPAVAVSKIERVIAEDLGAPTSACFSSFDPSPLGSASIAQVHAATLLTGERVAVKVARPGIDRTFRIDFFYLRTAARFATEFGLNRRLNLAALVRELTQMTREELDFRREARNAGLFQERLALDDVDHRAPRMYFELCGRRVITMERIRGVPMTTMLAAVRRNDRRSLDGWAERGIRPRRTGRLLLWSLLEQIMHHRVFNADPHPANLVVEDGGTLVWLDFGMVGWLDEQTWTQQIRMQRAIAQEQVQPAVEALLDCLAPLPARDLSDFEMQARGILRDWIQASRDPQATMAEKSTARFLVRLLESIRSAGISVPTDVLRMFRALIVSDAIVLQLDPSMDWIPELRAFIGGQAGRQLRTALRPDVSLGSVIAAGQAWLRFFTTSASLVNWLDDRIPEMTAAYQNKFSNLGRVGTLLLRYVRAGILAFVALVLIAHIPQLRAGALAWLDDRSGNYIGPIAIAGVLLFIVLSRILGELNQR